MNESVTQELARRLERIAELKRENDRLRADVAAWIADASKSTMIIGTPDNRRLLLDANALTTLAALLGSET